MYGKLRQAKEEHDMSVLENVIEVLKTHGITDVDTTVTTEANKFTVTSRTDTQTINILVAEAQPDTGNYLVAVCCNKQGTPTGEGMTFESRAVAYSCKVRSILRYATQGIETVLDGVVACK